MSSTLISVRLPSDTKELLDQTAAESGESRSALIQRYVEEGLRTDRHPGIVFRDGPAGRRPGVAGGPDVWEIVRLLRNLDESGDAAVRAAATELGLSVSQILAAVGYYAAHSDAVDAYISHVDAVAERSERQHRREQEALA